MPIEPVAPSRIIRFNEPPSSASALSRLHKPLEVADGFGDFFGLDAWLGALGREGLVLERADALVADFCKSLNDRPHVHVTPRHWHGNVLDRVELDVLDVHVEDAGVEFADRIDGVRLSTEIMADIEAESHARIEILHHVPCLLAGGEEIRYIRAMVVDGVADVVFFAEAAYVLAERARFEVRLLPVDHPALRRNAYDRLHAYTLCEVEIRSHLVLLGVIHVDRADAVSGDAVIRAFLLKRGDIGVSGLKRKMEVLDA